ncbi:hypothetical protein MMC28_003791 [Mycoblastus sanguinarius]|nr:hypothetical protein [Mycoblastus sanguinarius]
MADGNKSRRIWLLLLPRPPSDVSLNTLRVAYGPGLTRALQDASKVSAGALTPTLDIAIAYEDYPTFKFLRVQSLLGLMYRLICVICTEQSIDLHYDNDVDARFVLFHKKTGSISQQAELNNSIIDLVVLARCRRAWECFCSLESESGETLAREFLKIRTEHLGQSVEAFSQYRVPGGLSIQSTHHHNDSSEDVRRQHLSVAVGGTFDHLHAGHKLLLTMTALVLDPKSTPGRCLTVGITGDELLKKKKYQEELEDFYQRQSAIQDFLLDILEFVSPKHVLESTRDIPSSQPHGREVHNTLKSGLTIKYVEIFDPCGPTITDEAITALVLSAESRAGGKVVNDKRGEKGWLALDVFEVDVLYAGEDGDGGTTGAESKFESKISSTEIRRRIHQRSATAKGRS